MRERLKYSMAPLVCFAVACATQTPSSVDAGVTLGDAATDALVDATTDARDDADRPECHDGVRDLNSPGTEMLLSQMQSTESVNYANAVAAGVTFTPTSEGESFTAFWTPPGFDSSTDGFLVALHGHDGWVVSGFAASLPFLEARGYGFLALQWWFGEAESALDYYSPTEIHRELTLALAAHGIPPGRIVVEAFSRASANSYALTAIDHASSEPLFLLTIANSGQVVSDYAPTRAVELGCYGSAPLAGTHWVTFCGELDVETEMACVAMAQSRDWVIERGGVVDLFIDDPTAGHGGFHLNPDNANAAFDVYDTLLNATP